MNTEAKIIAQIEALKPMISTHRICTEKSVPSYFFDKA